MLETVFVEWGQKKLWESFVTVLFWSGLLYMYGWKRVFNMKCESVLGRIGENCLMRSQRVIKDN